MHYTNLMYHNSPVCYLYNDSIKRVVLSVGIRIKKMELNILRYIATALVLIGIILILINELNPSKNKIYIQCIISIAELIMILIYFILR